MKFPITGMGWVFPTSHGNRNNNVYHVDNDSHLPSLVGREVLKKTYKSFGRMDSFSKIGFSAVCFALEESGPLRYENSTAIIVSTVAGCLQTDRAYFKTTLASGGVGASPALFAYTLPNCFIGEAAIYHNLTGESFVLSETSTDGRRGVHMGLCLLESGEADRVICGVCDDDWPEGSPPVKGFKPGALFVIIDKKLQEHSVCYGKFERGGSVTEVLFNNKLLTSFSELAKLSINTNSL